MCWATPLGVTSSVPREGGSQGTGQQQKDQQAAQQDARDAHHLQWGAPGWRAGRSVGGSRTGSAERWESAWSRPSCLRFPGTSC